ncbi:MAG: carboxymuconolactone decarboxylase family protein [Beijerinckiaceae bacterium]|nr:carboxymuconolactone decarboxylase family protein [Beijerinckiaceae bacterium]
MTSSPPESRLPPVPEADLDEAQKKAVATFVETRGKHLGGVPSSSALAGPWSIFIRSPELMTLTQTMGEYLRYRSVIAGRLSELAILLVARHWTADFEWHAHAKIAANVGIPAAVIEAIREGRIPDELSGDERIIYNYVSEILGSRRVSDTTYARALETFGEHGVVDICGITGYYSMLALTMNAGRVQMPEGAERLPRFPE